MKGFEVTDKDMTKTISVLIQEKLAFQKHLCLRTLTYQYNQCPYMLKMLQLSREKNCLRTERNIPFKKGDTVVNLEITF